MSGREKGYPDTPVTLHATGLIRVEMHRLADAGSDVPWVVQAWDRGATGSWSRFALGQFETEAEARAYADGIKVGREA